MRVTFRWRVLSGVLRNAWPAWLALGGVALAVIVGLSVSPCRPVALRWGGMLLQMMGLGTVAFGLYDIRRQFGRPPLRESLLAYFRQLLSAFMPPKPITATFSATAADTVVAGEGVADRLVSSGAPLEERISALKADLDRLRGELDTKTRMLRERIDGVRESLNRETEERQVADGSMARKIEDVAVGGLKLEGVGLFWLWLGVLGTSIPDYLAAWVSLVV